MPTTNEILANARTVAAQSRAPSVATRTYALIVDGYDVQAGAVYGREMKTNEDRVVKLGPSDNPKRPRIEDFDRDPAKVRKMATAPGGVLLIRNALPKADHDEARWIERLTATGTKAEEGKVVQGMVQIEDAFQYKTKDGGLGKTRFVNVLDTRGGKLVRDAEQIATVMTEALSTPHEGAGQIALVQITGNDGGAEGAGTIITRKRDETAEEAVQRELINQKSFLVDTLIHQVGANEGLLAARVVTGHSYFIGSMAEQQYAVSGYDPVVRDSRDEAAWTTAVVHLLHHGNDPENPLFAAKVANTLARARIEPLTVDQIMPEKVKIIEKVSAVETAEAATTTQPAATPPAISGQQLGALGGDALTAGLDQMAGSQKRSTGPRM